jgi:hypothetical protein
MGFPQISHVTPYQSRGTSEGSDFNKIVFTEGSVIDSSNKLGWLFLSILLYLVPISCHHKISQAAKMKYYSYLSFLV